TLQGNFGKSFEGGKTQLFVTAQYSDQKPMYIGNRVNLLNNGYSTLMRNDPTYIYDSILAYPGVGMYGSTPNIAAYPGSGNLVLKSTGQALGSTFTFIPAGTSPTTPSSVLDAGLLQNAGHVNLTPGEDNSAPNGLLVPLGNFPRNKSLMATLTRQMTSKLQ